MNVTELKKLYKAIRNKTVKMPDGTSEKFGFTEETFLTKMSTKEQRKSFWEKYKEPLKKIGLKSWTYDEFEKQFGTPTSAVGNGENIKKLIAIDDDVEETTSPNQGVKVVKTKGGNRIRIFFNNGRYASRKNINNINDKTDEITGIWYFVGGDNYQIKYYNDNKTEVYDFKAKNIIKVSDKPFTPSPKTQGSSSKPILEKLMKIDSTIKKTTSPDQIIYTSDDKSQINIFFSDGNFRMRSNSVNNKNGEITGRWKFLGNDSYQINTSDGDVYTYPEGWKGVPTTSETAGGKLDLQKLIKIDSTIKKTPSPNQAISRFTDTNDNKKYIWIFFSDGDWRQRINSVNNKVSESIGKWYFTDNEKNYQIKSETYGDTFDFKTKKWVKPNSPSKTWSEVSFTLEDVLSGKGVIKKGDKGDVVKEVQKIMVGLNLGPVSKSGKPDGYFGKKTDLAVKQFQGNNMARGQQDGKVGQRTLKRMIELRDYDGSEPEVDTNQPQIPLDGQNVEPQTSQPQIPTGGENTTTAAPVAAPDTTQAPTATQPKKKLRLSPINE